MDEAAEKEKNIKQLRKQAEKKSGGKIVKLSGLSVKNTSRLIQELRIHQIEMKMQNEELRRTQTELEDSRNKYFSLFDFAPVGYFTLNQKNLIEEINLTAAEMLRAERSGLKRQRFTQYIVPDYQDVFYLHRKKIFDTNSRQTCELKLVRKDGNQFDAQLISVPCQAPDGSFNHLRIAVTDISAHVKKVEDEVRAANDLYQSLVENIDMGINLIDADYRIVMVNTMMSRWFNKAPRELIGVECFRAFEKRHAVCGHCPGRLAMIDGKSHVVDTEGVRDDGRHFPVQIHAFPLFDAEHRPKGFIEVVQDIAERKKTEQEIKNYQKQLKSLASRLSLSKEHEKQKIASGLHDNVCQRLALSKANLQRSIKSVSDAQTLDSLNSVCVEMNKIMEDIRLLTFELGNPVLNELGLTAAVEKYLTEEIQGKHGIRFELNSNLKNKELAETICGCLYRNIRELLLNIIKHARAHQVKVIIHKSADQINVCVEDDGIGFDTGRIAMLPTRTEGFGLFSIREQLEYLGGNIQIESNVGGGTKVSMTLPLKPEESVYL